MSKKRLSIKNKDFQEHVGLTLIFPMLLRYFLTELNEISDNKYININYSKNIKSIIYSTKPLRKYKKVTNDEAWYILHRFCEEKI